MVSTWVRAASPTAALGSCLTPKTMTPSLPPLPQLLLQTGCLTPKAIGTEPRGTPHPSPNVLLPWVPTAPAPHRAGDP